MIDGVALEEVVQYESHRNSIVGVCREHCGNLSLEVDNYSSIEVIAEALDTDGTVLAIAPVTHHEHYTPIPLILSPSCKKETGLVLKEWLEIFIQVWSSHPFGEALYGPIKSLASDEESSFRTARFQLCMNEDIDSSSVFGQVVHRLSGLNCQTGLNHILGTCDYKHIFKNKQNVPKAVHLIQSLVNLCDQPISAHPEEEKCQIAPFIDVTMDLQEQCHSLAIYAHFTAAMQLEDPNTQYYIILDGTNYLERIFSKVWTQDHNRNFDTQQLAQKLSIATEIIATFTHNPDLDAGHR
ncbi:hypothetical protein C8R42DRAFT_638886 [Lentinula raphanica]|nr:hypothetical protein C8R42DRAFT_638886 [Lentinula raphanica]